MGDILFEYGDQLIAAVAVILFFTLFGFMCSEAGAGSLRDILVIAGNMSV